jgi:ATP-dependent Clp protease ATP-binding subunit ClpB
MAGRENPNTLTLSRYTQEAKAHVSAAQALADERRHPEVLPLHLLVRLLERAPTVVDVLRASGVDVIELSAAANRALATVPVGTEPAYLSEAMLDLLARAERNADRLRSTEIGLDAVLDALSQEIRGPAGELLNAHGVLPGSLRPHYAKLRPAFGNGAASVAVNAISCTRDWVALARANALDPTIGRDGELRRLLTILERRTKCHPLIVGEAGVGKRALVGALARCLADGDVPTSLANARLLELDLPALLIGARLRSDAEERTRQLLNQFRDGPGVTILLIQSVDQLFAPGIVSGGVGDVIRATVTQSELRLLGTVTPEGRRRLQDRDPGLLRSLTTIELDEPSIERAIEIVRAVAARYEEHHQITIEESAVGASVRLAKRYLQDRFLPESAIDLLDEAAATLRVQTDGLKPQDEHSIQRLIALRAQIESLSQGQDADSHSVLQRLRTEATELEPKVQALRSERDSHRGLVMAVRDLREKLERAQSELVEAQTDKNWARVGELEHSVIPPLQQQLTQAQAKAGPTQSARPSLREQDVAQCVAAWTGIPIAKMLEAEAEKLLSMEDRLSQRVVGQSEAVHAVARAVRRGRVGLRDAKRPIGSFLFLGPSGVGKTELGKSLAEFLFDDEQALTRLDMSEFMERHMAQRLVGAPPGYADSEQGGFLTEAVRKRPYSVLLFDEVEKAHADVFNLLLQLLDDGRLTDGRGRLADFSNTVVILTSNIGADRILAAAEVGLESEAAIAALKDELLGELRKFFRPEMLNRIDDVVVFRPLSREGLARIARIQIEQLKRMVLERQLSIEIDAATIDRLVELGYDPALGARPLKRVMARLIQDPLAEALLGNRYQNGQTIRIALSPAGELQVAGLDASRSVS